MSTNIYDAKPRVFGTAFLGTGQVNSKEDKVCPYFRCLSLFQRNKSRTRGYGITCCGERKRFESCEQRNKMVHAYCNTTNFTECPFAKQYEELLDKFGEIKVQSTLYAGNKDIIDVDLALDVPDLFKYYNLAMDKPLTERQGLRAEPVGGASHKNSWVEADVKQLLDFISKYDFKTTAEKMGRSYKSVITKKNQLLHNPEWKGKVEEALNARHKRLYGRDKPPKITPAIRKRVAEEHIWGGRTLRSLADEFGITYPRLNSCWHNIIKGVYIYNWSHTEINKLAMNMWSSKVNTLEELYERVESLGHTHEEIKDTMRRLIYEDTYDKSMGVVKGRVPDGDYKKFFREKWSHLLNMSGADINEEKGEL